MGRNSVCPSVFPSVCWLEGSEGLPDGPEGLSEEPEGLPGGQGGRTDERTNGISSHSTGLRPLSGPLPKKRKEGLRGSCGGNGKVRVRS